jgi:hypothetical protein
LHRVNSVRRFGASLMGVVLAILETQGAKPEPRERARARRTGAARAWL